MFSNLSNLLVPHRLVVADGVELSAEHDGGEGEEEDRFQTEEDEQQHWHARGEVTALWGTDGGSRVNI